MRPQTVTSSLILRSLNGMTIPSVNSMSQVSQSLSHFFHSRTHLSVTSHQTTTRSNIDYANLLKSQQKALLVSSNLPPHHSFTTLANPSTSSASNLSSPKLTLSSDVVMVGGGAGGLELACKLGRLLGSEKVTLVDNKLVSIQDC
jgi:hypothetical protein